MFGDPVFVSGGYADYWYDYAIPDESELTVAERDAFFLSIDEGMQAFLFKQSEVGLKKEDAMEKALLAELDQLLTGLSNGKINAANGDVSYYWEDVSS